VTSGGIDPSATLATVRIRGAHEFQLRGARDHRFLTIVTAHSGKLSRRTVPGAIVSTRMSTGRCRPPLSRKPVKSANGPPVASLRRRPQPSPERRHGVRRCFIERFKSFGVCSRPGNARHLGRVTEPSASRPEATCRQPVASVRPPVMSNVVSTRGG
jgi:hypothetical protein